MPSIDVNGAVLAYEARGPRDADTLLLLHGLGSCAADWEPQLPAFEREYAVIAVDLAGHGRSTMLRGRPSIDAMAADVEVVLDTLGIRAAHVVGLSIGGCVALALALRAPGRVRSLVLVNTFARLRPAGPRAAARMLVRLALLLGAPMPALGRFVARTLFPHPAHTGLRATAAARLAANDRRAYFAAMRAIIRFDVRRRLGEIRCPTLVIAGACDGTIPLAAKQALADGIPGARLVVVLESGHVTNWDQPATFNRIVERFLTER